MPLGGDTLEKGSTIIITLKGIKNQNSVKDAGDFSITTLQFIDGEYYVVDESKSETSFVAVSGKVEPIGDILVSNPQNGVQDASYSFKFILEDDLPSSAYV